MMPVDPSEPRDEDESLRNVWDSHFFHHLRDASKIYPPPKKWVKVKKNRSTIISLHGIFSPPKKINNDVLTLELGEERQQQQKPIARRVDFGHDWVFVWRLAVDYDEEKESPQPSQVVMV